MNHPTKRSIWWLAVESQTILTSRSPADYTLCIHLHDKSCVLVSSTDSLRWFLSGSDNRSGVAEGWSFLAHYRTNFDNFHSFQIHCLLVTSAAAQPIYNCNILCTTTLCQSCVCHCVSLYCFHGLPMLQVAPGFHTHISGTHKSRTCGWYTNMWVHMCVYVCYWNQTCALPVCVCSSLTRDAANAATYVFTPADWAALATSSMCVCVCPCLNAL